MATPTAADLQTDFNNAVTEFGTPVTITYWVPGSVVYNTGSYDRGYQNTGSGATLSGLGIIQPIGRGDAQYVQQGRLYQDDLKLYLAGSPIIDGNAQVTIANTGSLYDIVPDTIQRWNMLGSTIYQVAYLRTRPSQTSP